MLDAYPHQLSGGMRQRVTIALATVCRPDFIIADEPTTALDVVVQKDVLAMIHEVQREIGSSMLFVTHDMAVHANLADRLGIMYAGRLVEEGRTADIFRRARHPYTVHLIASLPRIGDVGAQGGARPVLRPISPIRRPGAAFIRAARSPPSSAAARCRPWPRRRPAIASPASNPSPSHDRGPARRAIGSAPLRRTAVRAPPGRGGATTSACGWTQDRPEIFTIIGESGSGKTTLARMILGMLPPSAGTICFQGQDLTTIRGAARGWASCSGSSRSSRTRSKPSIR